MTNIYHLIYAGGGNPTCCYGGNDITLIEVKAAWKCNADLYRLLALANWVSATRRWGPSSWLPKPEGLTRVEPRLTARFPRLTARFPPPDSERHTVRAGAVLVVALVVVLVALK